MGITIPRINNGLELHLRASSRKLSSAITYAYHQSVVTNKYYRLAFSLNPEAQDTFWLEYADQPFFIRSAEEQDEYERKLDYLSEDDRQEAKKKETQFVRIEDHLNKEIKFPAGVDFKDVYVDHQEDKIERGMAYLYFFPHGYTEFAVINITDEDGNIFSLKISPLTGKVVPSREYLDYETVTKESEGI